MQREWFEKDYYAVLGVSSTATAKEITSAYRKLARELHPDANPGDQAAEDRFKDVSAAYEVVGDPDKRAEYDEARRMGPMGGGFGGAGFPPGGFGGGGAGGGFDAGNLGDLFGKPFGRGRAGAQPPTKIGPCRGPDLEAHLHLTFDDAVHGVTTTVNITSDVRCPDCKRSGAAPGTAPQACPQCGGRGAVDEDQGFFSFSRPCPGCGGRGRVIEHPCPSCAGAGAVRRPRQVKVRIPQGVRDGQRIRVKGKGGAGANGGPDGDLYVKVHAGAHPFFGRDRDHVTITVPITYPEAALGADIAVPTVEGESVTIRVPAGTRSGRTFRIRGRGVAGQRSKGDLLATVEVAIPQAMSDDERRALEAYAATLGESPRAHLGV